MAKFTGRLVSVGIGKESPRGTGASATYWIPKTAISFDDKAAKSMVGGSYGHISDAAMTGYVTSQWAEGDIEGEINVNSFGLILLALCGTDTPANPETGVYNHVYTLDNQVQHPSLSILVHDSIDDLRFRLAMINSLTIDIALGKIVTYVANWISKVHQDSTATTPSYSIDNRFTSKDLVFKVGSTIDNLGTAVSLKKLTIKIEKNVEKIDVLGTLEPEDIVLKGFKITGDLELNYEDRTWRDYMLNGSVKAMQIQLVNNKLIGATQKPTLNLIFPKVFFSEWEHAEGLEDIASQKLTFEILFDLAQVRLWSTFALTNNVVSY